MSTRTGGGPTPWARKRPAAPWPRPTRTSSTRSATPSACRRRPQAGAGGGHARARRECADRAPGADAGTLRNAAGGGALVGTGRRASGGPARRRVDGPAAPATPALARRRGLGAAGRAAGRDRGRPLAGPPRDGGPPRDRSLPLGRDRDAGGARLPVLERLRELPALHVLRARGAAPGSRSQPVERGRSRRRAGGVG